MLIVYIIYSVSLDKYYVGYSSGIKKRFNDHNSGVSSVRSRPGDWKLRCQEVYKTPKEATQRERSIKSKKSLSYLIGLIEQSAG